MIIIIINKIFNVRQENVLNKVKLYKYNEKYTEDYL